MLAQPVAVLQPVAMAFLLYSAQSPGLILSSDCCRIPLGFSTVFSPHKKSMLVGGTTIMKCPGIPSRQHPVHHCTVLLGSSLSRMMQLSIFRILVQTDSMKPKPGMTTNPEDKSRVEEVTFLREICSLPFTIFPYAFPRWLQSQRGKASTAGCWGPSPELLVSHVTKQVNFSCTSGTCQ